MSDDQEDMSDDRADAMAAILEESKADVAQQNSNFDSLRTRAVAMLSVETLVAGLFGSHLPSGHVRALNTGGLVAALVLFAGSVALVVAIALPRAWTVAGDRRPLVERVSEGTATLAEVNYALAVNTEEQLAANTRVLASMSGLFGVLCMLAFALVVAWAIAVI